MIHGRGTVLRLPTRATARVRPYRLRRYVTLQVELPAGQSAVNLPPLTVTVSNSAPVTVAPAPLQVQHRIYLPSVQR